MNPRLKVGIFCEILTKHGIENFYGVPDSITGPLCKYLTNNFETSRHIIAANEGNAVALGIGSYVSTGKIPVIYMQNSGLGNALDPLVSLVDESVYHTPLLLVIGWRGQSGLPDEPQHIKQGEITIELLKSLDIANEVLSNDEQIAKTQVKVAVSSMQKTGKPYALIVQKDTFKLDPLTDEDISGLLYREEALKIITDTLNSRKNLIIAGIGKISRELSELSLNTSLELAELLVVGGMGHASSLALSVALNKSDKVVYCLDGDGSVLMHMGAFATIGSNKPKNFIHIVFNNGVHDSVGAMPTTAPTANLSGIAINCGYKQAYTARNKEEIQRALTNSTSKAGPLLIEVVVKPGAREDLKRPPRHPSENLKNFMEKIKL